MSFALISLAITAFSIGMTEFVVIGMLPQLAEGFSISKPTTGLIVTLYAFSVMIAAPLLTALTMKIQRKKLMLGIIFLFILGNTISAFAPNFYIMLLGRCLAGMAHGTFFAIATKIAIQIVDKSKQASAIALMFSGLTVALVFGVPFGSLLAGYVSWQATFYIIVTASILAFIGIWKWIPNKLEMSPATPFFSQFSFLKNKSMLSAYAITILSFGGPFVAYTYISVILSEISGFSLNEISGILFLYGVAVAFGNIYGGKFSDKFGVTKTLKLNVVLLVLILILFGFSQYSKIFSVINLTVWGALAFSIAPAGQYLVMKIVAKHKIKAEEIASGINIAAFNLGISSGSFIGSIVVREFSITWTPFISAFFVLLSYFFISYVRKKENL